MRQLTRGFTLVEILVVLQVMAMTAFLSFAVYASSLRTAVMDRVMIQGKEVAARQLMEVMARPCEWAFAQPTITVLTDEGRSFERHVTVTVLPTELWQMRVDVRWRVAGRPQETTLLHHHALYGLVCPQWVYPYGQ